MDSHFVMYVDPTTAGITPLCQRRCMAHGQWMLARAEHSFTESTKRAQTTNEQWRAFQHHCVGNLPTQLRVEVGEYLAPVPLFPPRGAIPAGVLTNGLNAALHRIERNNLLDSLRYSDPLAWDCKGHGSEVQHRWFMDTYEKIRSVLGPRIVQSRGETLCAAEPRPIHTVNRADLLITVDLLPFPSVRRVTREKRRSDDQKWMLPSKRRRQQTSLKVETPDCMEGEGSSSVFRWSASSSLSDLATFRSETSTVECMGRGGRNVSEDRMS